MLKFKNYLQSYKIFYRDLTNICEVYKNGSSFPVLQEHKHLLSCNILPFSLLRITKTMALRSLSSLQTVSLISIHGPLFYKVQKEINAHNSGFTWLGKSVQSSYNFRFRACLIIAILFVKSSKMKVEFYHYSMKG